jgi:hypothetical protein
MKESKHGQHQSTERLAQATGRLARPEWPAMAGALEDGRMLTNLRHSSARWNPTYFII